MARGICSALGHWPEAELSRVLEMLRAIGREVERRVPEDQHGLDQLDAGDQPAERDLDQHRPAERAIIAIAAPVMEN